MAGGSFLWQRISSDAGGNAVILYLAATVCTILFAVRIRSAAVRSAGRTVVPQGFITREILKSRVLLVGIFLILFGILALRINVGNDYMKYVEFMHLARSGFYVPTEIGFNLLSRASFLLFNGENFLFCFAVMAFVTVLCFLKAIDGLSESFLLSFAMFMLLGYYFQSISTVRYYFALAVTTFAIVSFLKKDYPKFVLLVLFAATFHKSALIVLFLYPAAKLRYRRWVYFALAAGGFAGFLLREPVLKLLLMVYSTYQETGYAAGGEGSLVSIVRCLLVLVLTVFCDRESLLGAPMSAAAGEEGCCGTAARRFYCHLNILALILYVFFAYLPIISRIGYYLTVTHIFYVPMLIRRMPDGRGKKTAIAVTALFCIGFFAHMMWHAGDDGLRILPYQTFVFHEMPPTLSDKGY